MAKLKRSPNGYIIFTKFYNKFIKETRTQPQYKFKKTGEFWRYIPNDLKNSFIKYANNERLLKDLALKQSKSILATFSDDIIHDDFCYKLQKKENNCADDATFDQMFETFVDPSMLT
ncbi:hypothetical protein C1645_744159 [Glomus cerebriforme]|uniref:HMG box domain-containing protein n=1 Tax=Glomus cerebriforme TaxID=658196 RepID=A0A397SC91_9GLOM|nr:hypothetical protein C1645_744159 [Glomus cerebriforme]